MDEVNGSLETRLVQVRADTRGFAVDVAAMRGTLEGSLSAGAEHAGRAIESGLARALRTGKLGFDDLRRTALGVLGEIAAAALTSGLSSLGGGRGGGRSGGLGSVLGALLGAPGRATGGPVSPARPYWVGERGPELFVPTASGRIEPAGAGGGARQVNVAIRVTAEPGAAPAALQRSSRQVARAVRAALDAQD